MGKESSELRDRIREKHKTARALIYTAGIVLAIAIIALTVIKLNDQPPWLVLCLAIFGPSGTIVVLFVLYLRHLRTKIAETNRDIDDELLDDQGSGEFEGE